MASMSRSWILILLLVVLLFASNAHAFGAGNIASISAIEGKNWRHGDIEDMLKQISCIRHHKWNSMMIKRVYFGNWLRDYSQAVDVGTLKKTNSETIRVLVWLLSFLGFGYATAEFEVTAERLGTYRPEEHIDNPKDYNDNEDARKYDARLRGPVRQIELDIDPNTGMKNYIANGRGDWATSSAYVKYSFERSIHHGRAYINGAGWLSKGKDEDLAEALRCLGQGLHTLEDFGAHTNYVELVLAELGFRNVFPLVGTQTGINLRGKRVFPLVTGTFGAVDFYHSVLGEATDHFTQSEVNEMDNAMGIAQTSASSSNPLTTLVKLLGKMPGTKDLCDEAERLQATSSAQNRFNSQRGFGEETSRGVDGFAEGTRSTSEDWNAPRSNYSDPQAYPGAGYQQGYQHHPPQPSWGGPAQIPQYHELPAEPYNNPPHGQYNQWQQPQPPQQGDNSYNSQDYNQQGYPGDAYGQSHSQWQPPHATQQQAYLQPQTSAQPPMSSPDTTPAHTPAAPSLSKPASAVQQPNGLPGMPDFDPAKFVQQIYPILAFRDKVVRTISSIIEKIPGLEALVDRIVETLTVFILSLLAPFVRPVIKALTKSLQVGSEGVIDSSGKHQYEVFTDARCSDPTHSMLSKDHFSNILNPPAGAVAAEILQYIAPRVLYAWEHPDVPVDRVMADVDHIFHHPAIRDERNECHRNMFNAVKRWVDSLSDRGRSLDTVLSLQGVKDGKNHKAGVNEHQAHGSSMTHGGHGSSYGKPPQQAQQSGFSGYLNQAQNLMGGSHQSGHSGGHGSSQGGIGGYLNQAQNLVGSISGQSHGGGQQHHYGGSGGHHSGGGGQGGGLNDMLSMANKLPIPGVHQFTSTVNKFNKFSNLMPGGRTRGMDDDGAPGEGTRGITGEPGDARETSGYENVQVPHMYAVGGAGELYDAVRQGSSQERSPSPMPLAAPSGYEAYTGTGPYEGSGYQGYQQQPGGHAGGASSTYYGGSGDGNGFYR